jgi:hypothetical protein
MSDNLKQRGGQDRTRINVNEDYELRDWSKRLNVTPDRLKEAVQAVGDRADKVEQYLQQGQSANRAGSSERGGGSRSSER